VKVDGGRKRWAHRLAYELSTGVPLGPLLVEQICGNLLCCNPRHLQAVTMSQRQRRRAGPNKNNKSSGVRGVTQHGSRWRAYLVSQRRRILVGMYDSVEEADSAVRKARSRLGGATT
jgi:hypothetical protein